MRRSHFNRVANLPKTVEALRRKYGHQVTNVKSTKSKRASTAAIPMTCEENDFSYSALPQNFNLILDTGASDFWVVTTSCTSCGSDIPEFNPSNSSTYKATSSNLELYYGSGSAQGVIVQDSVTFGSFELSQEFLAVNVTSGLIYNGLSGVMGLGFTSISTLQTTPFWEALYNANDLAEPFAAPGGYAHSRRKNSSLYTGSIEYLNMTSPSSFWLLTRSLYRARTIAVDPLSGLASIDTSITLIGAPTPIAASIWAQVPGSTELTGNSQGLYAFPCDTNVTVRISFGGTNWAISPLDMNIGTVNEYDPTFSNASAPSQMCVGAIFDVGIRNAPAWIIGATFLKNVYSVFRANPAAVGFAQLASGLSPSTGSPEPSPVVTGSTPSPSNTSASSSGSSTSSGSASPIKNIALTSSYSL
ncbi:aspartic peptidase domain-containing protein [Suillus cothurnatus]|nr:aspartic peptidase domain-containing protein [Suillus cothurnatus]